MTVIVADTSALLSIASAPSVLDTVFDEYDVLVPREVVDELEETAEYDDETARAADVVMSRLNDDAVREAELNTDFPLDEGENAAVSLANEKDADLFLCDEFNRIGLIHASLTDVRLVTTPKLLEVLVHKDALSEEEAIEALDDMTEARSWKGNSYVQRARESLLAGS
jgi:predicted nucleic acid-binding protein